ncbi:MAG TPA: 2'-5' RNA ligase family protein [Solirubrobacteraceae bacterium]
MVEWYVMLFPAARTPRRYARLAQRWAAAVGGVVNPDPHVTIAYLVGPAEPAAVVAAMRALPADPVMVEADGALSYSQTPHALFGYSASLRVLKTPELGSLHRAVLAGVRQLGLTSLYVWEDVDPHLQVLRQLPAPPPQFLPRLAALHAHYRFTATHLVLSRPDGGGGYPVELSRRLRPGRPTSRVV